MLKNYYEILGVPPVSTDGEIHDAYLRLARKFHPDLGGDRARFDEINEAYRFLSDKVKRLALDAQLRVRRPVTGNAKPAAADKDKSAGCAKTSAPPQPAKPERANVNEHGVTDAYVRTLESQVDEYEKLLLVLSRCSVTPPRPELSSASLELLVRRNRSERGKARR